jgi:hypothetical protein
MDEIELRYQAVQCLLRARRIGPCDDALWLQKLASELLGMADLIRDRCERPVFATSEVAATKC